MVKLVQVYGAGNYIFNGYNNVVIRVTKETKDALFGYVTNLVGNFNRLCDWDEDDGEKIVIMKRNIQGWKELKW